MFAMPCRPWRGSGESPQVTFLALRELMLSMPHVPPLGWRGMPLSKPRPSGFPTAHTHPAAPRLEQNKTPTPQQAPRFLPITALGLVPPASSFQKALGCPRRCATVALVLTPFSHFFLMHFSCVFTPPYVVSLVHIPNPRVLSGATLGPQFGYLTGSC